MVVEVIRNSPLFINAGHEGLFSDFDTSTTGYAGRLFAGCLFVSLFRLSLGKTTENCLIGLSRYMTGLVKKWQRLRINVTGRLLKLQPRGIVCESYRSELFVPDRQHKALAWGLGRGGNIQPQAMAVPGGPYFTQVTTLCAPYAMVILIPRSINPLFKQVDRGNIKAYR